MVRMPATSDITKYSARFRTDWATATALRASNRLKVLARIAASAMYVMRACSQHEWTRNRLALQVGGQPCHTKLGRQYQLATVIRTRAAISDDNDTVGPTTGPSDANRMDSCQLQVQLSSG